MAEYESVFATVVAAIRPLLLGGTIRDAERIALAALRAAHIAADDGHPLRQAEAMEQLAAANDRASLPNITDGITNGDAEASATFGLTIDEVRSLKADRDAANERAGKAEARLAKLDKQIGKAPGLGGYTIGCDGDDATMWPYVECSRCRYDVWTGEYTRSALNLADAVDQAAAHDCDKAATLRNIITEGG